MGKPEEASQHYKEALRLDPDLVEAHMNLGNLLLARGEIQDAIAQYKDVLRLKPESAEAHNYLGRALARSGRAPEAIEHYEEALRFKPNLMEAQNNLAWLLATWVSAEGGGAARAVTLAEAACKLTDNRVAAYLDTLAAAYAAAGRFQDATSTAQKAIEIARAEGRTELVEKIEARLKLYRSERAYPQPVSETEAHAP
jgi:spermidine synthase